MPIREKVLLKFELLRCSEFTCLFPGADPGFQVRGGALIFFLGVFRVKNHDLTPKNHIFSNFRGVISLHVSLFNMYYIYLIDLFKQTNPTLGYVCFN